MSREETIEATFVAVSVHANVEANPDEVRDILVSEATHLDGFVVPNTPYFVVGFEDDSASVWVDQIRRELGHDASKFSLGVDRGVAVRAFDFLTEQEFIRSDAMERSMELARFATRGTLAVGLDARVVENNWDKLFDFVADPSAKFRCQIAPLTSASSPTAAVSIPEHTLVGRDALLGQLFDMTVSERFVWLHGATGVGKSAVAAKFASWWRGTLKRDVAWIDARRHKTLDDIIFEFARQLSVRLNHPREFGSIVRALRHVRDLLVVIDQADAIADDLNELFAELDDLDLRVLTTVRRPPDGFLGQLIEAQPLPEAAIVATIAGRLGRPIMSAELHQLAEACAGRPALAHWAAAQCAHHGVNDIISELTGVRPSATVTGMFENTFSFSWTRLNPIQREAIRFLAAFEGGAPLEAIEQTFSEFQNEKHLNSVDFRTFVEVDAESEEARVQLYPQAAKFVGQNVAPTTEHDLAQGNYMLERARRQAELLSGPEETRVIHQLKSDLANLRKAMNTLWDNPDAITVLVGTVERSLRVTGPVAGQSDIMERIATTYGERADLMIPIHLERARNSMAKNRFDDAYSEIDLALELLDDAPSFRSEAYLLKGAILQSQAKVEDAVRWIQSATDHAHTDPERWRALSLLGITHLNIGNDEAAAQLFREVLLVCNVPSIRANVCRAFGILLAGQDELTEAETYFDVAFRYYSDIGNLRDLVPPILSRARALFRSGDRHEALRVFEHAVQTAKRAGIPASEVSALAESALYRILDKDLIHGVDEINRALGLNPPPSVLLTCRVAQTLAFSQMGALHEAEHSMKEAVALHQETECSHQSEFVPIARGFLLVAKAKQNDLDAETLSLARDIVSTLTVDPRATNQSRFLTDLLQREIARVAPSNGVTATLTVSHDGRWFQRQGESKVDITRRAALKRLVVGLVQNHQSAPGTVISLDDAFEIGWPGEKAMEQSKIRRVYSTVNRLRNLGFQEIVTADGGYFIDPSAMIQTVDDSSN